MIKTGIGLLSGKVNASKDTQMKSAVWARGPRPGGFDVNYTNEFKRKGRYGAGNPSGQ